MGLNVCPLLCRNNHCGNNIPIKRTKKDIAWEYVCSTQDGVEYQYSDGIEMAGSAVLSSVIC
jgi:hypothetical protein